MTHTRQPRHPALVGPRPPKVMLAELLLGQITEMMPGEQIPSINALTAKYGVAKNTARAAISILAKAGLVETHQGHGTFVSQSVVDNPAAA